MAKVQMYPPDIPESASSAEEKIFEELKNLNLDCTIFHSIGMAEHLDKVYGEIDFIILSHHGVLCLEVKGGGVECENNKWLYINKRGEFSAKDESPFRQAVRNMFSLRSNIQSRVRDNSNLKYVQFACAVALPDIVFTCKQMDFNPKLIYDVRRTDMDVLIRDAYCHWAEETFSKTGHRGNSLTSAEIDALADIIQPSFSAGVKLSTILDDSERRIEAFTRDQAEFLTAQTVNPRMMIRGGAGTGKTVMGMEIAKAAAQDNKRVLFLTYTKNISAKIERELHAGPHPLPLVEVIHFHGLLDRYVRDTSSNYDADTYFNKIQPNLFADAVRDCKVCFEPYDVLIFDEGQDLIRLSYLDCFEAMLKGGLNDGIWYCFFDNNQNLYNRQDFEDGIEYLKTVRPANYILTTNCRNTQKISDYNHTVTHIESLRHLKNTGMDVEKIIYSDNKDLYNKLRDKLKYFHAQGIPYGDITILTRHKYDNSPLKDVTEFKSICSILKINEKNVWQQQDNLVRHCTVHGFKGLDSKIIFYIGDVDCADEKERYINYTAISRARSALVVFEQKNGPQEIGLSFLDEPAFKHTHSLLSDLLGGFVPIDDDGKLPFDL